MFDDLVIQVSVKLPDPPLVTVREMLRRAMQELAEEGNIWTERQTLAVTDGNPPSALLEAATADACVVRVLSLSRQGSPVEYRQVAPDRVELPRMPTADVEAELALSPVEGADLPEPLMRHWRKGLIHGALYRLLVLPEPWQNFDLAGYHERQFRAAIVSARQVRAHGYEQKGARVRPVRFI